MLTQKKKKKKNRFGIVSITSLSMGPRGVYVCYVETQNLLYTLFSTIILDIFLK